MCHQSYLMDKSYLQGGFFICAILLFYPVSADSALPAAGSVHSTRRVANMTFSSKLSNPCSLDNPSSLNRDTFKDAGEIFLRGLVSGLRQKAPSVKEDAESLLGSHFLEECRHLTLPDIAVIPEAENTTLLAVLNSFYTSVLNHTAYVYLISENFQPLSDLSSCESLHGKTEGLAFSMKDLLCQLRTLILVLPDDTGDDIFQISTHQILNEEFAYQPVCSRRLFQECQTIRSTISLMTALQNFLQTAVYFQDPTTIFYDETTIVLQGF